MSNAKDNVNVSFDDDKMNHISGLKTKFLGFVCFTLLGWLLLLVVLSMLLGCIYYPKTVGLYLVLPYYTYTRVIRCDELHHGNHWPAFSQHFPLFHSMRAFLGLLEIEKPNKLQSNQQCIFAVFPHGVNADYRILMDGMLLSHNLHVRVLAATVLFYIPLVRELALWTGCVDARKSVATRLVQNGYSLLVLPGGQAEQIQTIRTKEVVYLQKRKGFVKLALQHDVPLVPTYVFGCSDYYNTSHACLRARLWLLKSFGICIPLATGYMSSFFCPFPVKTTIVIGEPIQYSIKEEGNPTREEVDAAHAQFMTALTRLFNEHKTRLGYGDRELEII